MKAYVDKNLCIGCGICEGVCPAVFKMEDDGLAVAIDSELDDMVIADAKDAESQCPVDAIKIS